MPILVAITTRVSCSRNYRIRLPHIHKRILYLSAKEHEFLVNFVTNFPHYGCHGNRVRSVVFRVIQDNVMMRNRKIEIKNTFQQKNY